MKTRDNGVDLLRILLALMVITLHYNSSLGQVQVNTEDLSFNWFFVWFSETICICAVNVYVIITGYYSYIGNKDLSYVISKLKSLWLCVVSYSVIEYLVINVATGKSIGISSLLFRFLPITTGEWWFFSLYFVIYLISPFLNKVIGDFDNRTLSTVFSICIVVLCIIPQILLCKDGLGIENGYSLIWFLFLYGTGAVLAKQESDKQIDRLNNTISYIEKYKGLVLVCCLVVLYGSKICIALVSNYLWGEVKYSGLLYSYNSIFVYLAAIAMFFVFKSISIKNNTVGRLIAFVSPLALASYLFHCQLDFREQIWPMLECYRYSNEKIMPIMYVMTTIGIFVVAIIIEFIRTNLLKIIKKTRN